MQNTLALRNDEILTPRAHRPRRTGLLLDGIQRRPAGRTLTVEEVWVAGVQVQNLGEPSTEIDTLRNACSDFADRNLSAGVALLVFGDHRSRSFQHALEPLPTAQFQSHIPVDLLLHPAWRWDLRAATWPLPATRITPVDLSPATAAGLDPVVRWGGRRRLSGWLPLQAAHADLYVVDVLWLDRQSAGFIEALRWYALVDRAPAG